jgi:hypothetical protein
MNTAGGSLVQEQIRTYKEEATAIRYLLGDLEDGEASAVEQQYFSDRAYFQHLETVEAALIRTYLANTLGPHEKTLFEQKYLNVPELRKKVMLVKRFQELEPDRSSRSWFWPGVVVWRPAIGYGLAVALLAAAVSTGWLFTRSQGLEREIARLRAAPPQRPVQDTSIAQQGSSGGVFSIVLLPGLLRGQGQKPHVLTAAAAQEIRLQLDLPGLRSDSPLAVALYRAGAEDRRLIWSSAGLHPAPTPQGRTVLISFSADALGPGDYVVYVKPSLESPASSALGAYSFSISAE